MTLDWFAVQVKARWEQSTAKLLTGKGYEILLPLYQEERHWGRRIRKFDAPLFRGYVFCQFDVLKRLPILVTPGVIGIVSLGRVPISINPSEIQAIQAMVSSGVKAEPWPYLEIGQRVRIEDSSMRGVEGILLAHKGSHRVVLSITLLQRSVALEIDRRLVTPIAAASEEAGTSILTETVSA